VTHIRIENEIEAPTAGPAAGLPARLRFTRMDPLVEVKAAAPGGRCRLAAAGEGWRRPNHVDPFLLLDIGGD
jgi:hypothetical protein